MHFMVFCTLQKVNVRVALCIINKSGQDHLLATVKTFSFGQQILQAGTLQGGIDLRYQFLICFCVLLSVGNSHPLRDATFSTSILSEVEDITHVIEVGFQMGSLLVMQS